MTRLAATLPLLLLALLAFAGCDSSDDGPHTEAYSFGLTLYFDDMQHTDFVASRSYDRVDIPPSAVDHGAVIVYYRDQGTWTALPMTIGLEKPDEPVVDYTVTFGYGYDVNFLELFFEASSADPVVWEEIADIYSGGIDLKVVVLNSYVATDQEVDLTDYQAVKQHFRLVD